MSNSPPSPPQGAALTVQRALILSVWFGIVTGLVEGVGLLLFQWINWERWGPIIHVTARILWISAVVDVLLFTGLALGIAGVTKLIPRISIRDMACVLATLTIYDWLMLTERLHPRSCALLAFGLAVTLGRWLTKHESAALRFWKRSFPWVVATAVLVFLAIEGGSWVKERRELAHLPSAAPGAPNVLVIVVDTLRADHLSSYGYAHLTSPNIDRLAKEGALFENAVSASSWTFPSHVSLVTGRYPFQHGLGNVPRVPLVGTDETSLGGYPTIGEVLSHRGYRTGAFSANRSYFTGNLGFSRGFAHFEDYYHSAPDMFVRTLYGRELVKLYVKWIDQGLKTQSSQYGRNYVIRKTAEQINHEVLRWVDRDQQRPFFAFLNYFDVHDPYGGRLSSPKNAWDPDEYDNGIKFVDDYIGQLAMGLQQRGIDKNTLLIITSDHGESLGEHGIRGHNRTLYWSLIHVPLVILYPGHIPAGIRIAQPVSNVAIAATITDLLGIGNSSNFLGPALSPLWKKPETGMEWPSPFSELAQNKFLSLEDAAADHNFPTGKAGPMRSLITGKWHLIVHKKLGHQLYDLVNDPGETRDLINTPEGQEVAQDMVPRMNQVLAVEAVDGPEQRASAIDLPDGDSKIQSGPTNGKRNRGIDYYRVRTEGGSKLTIRVLAAHSKTGGQLDTTLAIENPAGEIYRTCRDPGDDKIEKPGVADPTPQALDDICMNDDIKPGVNTDSQLEILVPGAPNSSVELYLRVAGWNGSIDPNMAYQITVSH